MILGPGDRPKLLHASLSELLLLGSEQPTCFLRAVWKRNIEEGDVRMLEFQLPFSNREVSVAHGQELLFIEIEVPLIIGRPFKFLSHGQRIDRTGLHAHAAEQAASHVHVVFFGVSFNRLAGNFGADNRDDTAWAGGFAKITTHAFISSVVVPEQDQHPPVIIWQGTFFMRILNRDGSVMDQMHERGFHAQGKLIEGDRLQPFDKPRG
jgi:hypothetical protein